jgi:hypothetical protein
MTLAVLSERCTVPVRVADQREAGRSAAAASRWVENFMGLFHPKTCVLIITEKANSMRLNVGYWKGHCHLEAKIRGISRHPSFPAVSASSFLNFLQP